ncbi:hypothetical protein ACFONC_06760 [Luteimonas soli]|uniref:HEPN AbiU2-like domain-containing protein n=1 Tax=Luteimonas soli TaxID=1648966 RepID=A0ABV7XI85_9GAMM
MAGPVSDVTRKVSNDFKGIWDSHDRTRVGSEQRQRDLLRSTHRFAYCISLFAKAATALEEHRRVFLQELASDALHLVHVLMAGDGRAGSFYLRSLIENFWRHHYFKDHFVEYEWLTSRRKYYMTLKDLRDYCSWLTVFSGKLGDSLRALETKYADLSKQVHSTSVRTLVLRDSLEQIKLSSAQATELAPVLREVFRDVIALLAFANRDLFDGMHVNSQDFIKASLDVKRRERLQADLAR